MSTTITSYYPLVFQAIPEDATLVLTGELEFKLLRTGKPPESCDDAKALEIIRACAKRMVADSHTRKWPS